MKGDYMKENTVLVEYARKILEYSIISNVFV